MTSEGIGARDPTNGPPRTTPAPTRIVLILGHPRSGTTALFESLASDPTARVHHEPADPDAVDAVYVGARLRPASELAPVMEAASGPVLARHLESFADRSIDDLLADLDRFDPIAVWIYRDPVNVLASALRKGLWDRGELSLDEVVDVWVRMHEAVVACTDPRLLVVRYEDLAERPDLLTDLGRHLRLRTRSTFGADLARSRHLLDSGTIRRIEQATTPMLGELDRRRSIVTDSAPPPFTPPEGAVPPTLAALADAGVASTSPASAVRVWLTPEGLSATEDGRVTRWQGALGHLPDAAICSGAPMVTAGGTPRVSFPAAGPHPDVLCVPGTDLPGPTDPFTLVAVLHLPVHSPHRWSPIVSFGSVALGTPGYTLTWLGESTDQRPSPTSAGLAPPRLPVGWGLLVAAVSPGFAVTPTTANQFDLVVKVEAAAGWSVAVVRHRPHPEGAQLELATTVRCARVDASSPATTVRERGDHLADRHDGLMIGSLPGLPGQQFDGEIAELQLHRGWLDDDAVGALLADLRRRVPPSWPEPMRRRTTQPVVFDN